jgi:hypothetical protein
MDKQRRLEDAYRFPGFEPEKTVRGVFGDPKARIVRLQRRRKKRPVVSVGNGRGASTIASFGASAISPVRTRVCTWRWRFGGSTAGGVVP